MRLKLAAYVCQSLEKHAHLCPATGREAANVLDAMHGDEPIQGDDPKLRAIRVHVEAEDKQTVSVGLRGCAPFLINESGLYSLIMAS